MANEIQTRPYLKCTNGNASITIQTPQLSFDQTASGFYHQVASIGTSEESIGTFGDVATEGWIYMRNIDATNYVQWGVATTVYAGRLEAGEVAMFRAEPGLTLFLKANTTACKVEILCLED